MPRVGFEPTVSAGERPKTYALDRAATGTGRRTIIQLYSVIKLIISASCWLFKNKFITMHGDMNVKLRLHFVTGHFITFLLVFVSFFSQ